MVTIPSIVCIAIFVCVKFAHAAVVLITTDAQAENCPILKCDFFSHKEIHLGWRVKRKDSQSRKKTAMQKLDEILAKLDRLC